MMYESDADGRMDHLAPTGQPRHQGVRGSAPRDTQPSKPR